ncbi:MAG TPA: hypothetical protein DC047_14520 [Blastocatellia bacterium]|nr:hypothetical protein [Blastocatellia bacterium]
MKTQKNLRARIVNRPLGTVALVLKGTEVEMRIVAQISREEARKRLLTAEELGSVWMLLSYWNLL